MNRVQPDRLDLGSLFGAHTAESATIANPLAVTDWPRDAWVGTCARGGIVYVGTRREVAGKLRRCGCGR